MITRHNTLQFIKSRLSILQIPVVVMKNLRKQGNLCLLVIIIFEQLLLSLPLLLFKSFLFFLSLYIGIYSSTNSSKTSKNKTIRISRHDNIQGFQRSPHSRNLECTCIISSTKQERRSRNQFSNNILCQHMTVQPLVSNTATNYRILCENHCSGITLHCTRHDTYDSIPCQCCL